MRNRSLGLTLFSGLAILVAACGGGASPSPSAASQPPAASASAPASVEPSGSAEPSGAATVAAALNGLVTGSGPLIAIVSGGNIGLDKLDELRNQRAQG